MFQIKNYLLENPITSTENNEIDITVKTVPNNNTLPEAQTPKALEQTKLLGLPSVPPQGSLSKALIQDPGRKPTSLGSPRKPLNQNDLSSKSALPCYALTKSNPVLSNKIISPVQTAQLLQSPSPIKVPVKKSTPLLETRTSKSNSHLKTVPLLDSASSKSNSLLASNSFSSLDTSWPLSLSKSIYSMDGAPLSFDNVITKPLVEVQAPESIINSEKFNHKDSSQFIVLDNFNTSLTTGSQQKQEDSELAGSSNEVVTNTNTEIHVLKVSAYFNFLRQCSQSKCLFQVS